jgi:succinoglycan biosynthesis transport protein ExoP
MSASESSPLPTPVARTVVRGVSAATAVLRAVRKHWPLIVALVLLGGGAGLLISKSLTRIYDATALIELNAEVVRPLGSKDDMQAPQAWWDNEEYYETQYRIVTSHHMLSAVVRDLNLTNDFEFLGYKSPPTSAVSVDDAADALQGHVRVEAVKNSRLFVLHVEDKDPKRARRICSALANTYVAQNLESAVNGSSDAVVWLNGQVDHVKQDLDNDENSLHDFKQRNDLPSISINEAANMLRLEMQEFDTALAHTRTRKQELLARYAELSKVSADSPDVLPASELLASAFLQSLRAQYQDATKERSALIGEGKGENHPSVRRADEKIATTKAALLAEVRNIQGAVGRDLAVVSREEAGESGLFEATRKRAVDLNMKEIEYHRLDRAREQNEKLYGTLLERMKEADLTRMMRVNNIRVVDDALEPSAPIRPRPFLNLFLGLAFGLGLGIALAWLRENLDSSLRTPDDLERELGLTFLGLLPELSSSDEPRRRTRPAARSGTDALPSVELVVHNRPLSGAAEAARSIRTNLMFMSPDHPHRKLLVSSAAPAEGKTTVACSIAIAFAQGGQRVCIVDCDLRRPRIHRIFGRAGDAGVTDVLVGNARIDEVAKPTGIDNLWSIVAGPMPPNPADLLHSERFRRFVEDLGDRFDRVIIDSAPLVAVTDSAIISRLVDGTVFVVKAFTTSKHLSAQGLRALRDVDAPVVGAVLNSVNLNRHEYTHYYHYYYYKREGYRSAPVAAEDDSHESVAPPN